MNNYFSEKIVVDEPSVSLTIEILKDASSIDTGSSAMISAGLVSKALATAIR